jgi:hypothetical protein
MENTLDIINAVLTRYGIEPFVQMEEICIYEENMPTMTEAEKKESLRLLWLKIAERETAKDRVTKFQTIPQMALV